MLWHSQVFVGTYLWLKAEVVGLAKLESVHESCDKCYNNYSKRMTCAQTSKQVEDDELEMYVRSSILVNFFSFQDEHS